MITIVLGNLGSGGLERITAKIANWYSDRGHKVTLVCLLDYENKIFVKLNPDINVIFYKNKKEPSRLKKMLMPFRWIRFLKHIFDSQEKGIVLAMTLKIAALCCLANKKSNHRLVMREISDPKSKDRSRIMDCFLFVICRKVDSIIFQTNWERKCYPKFLRKKGSVVQNPSNVFVRSDGRFTNEIVTMGRLLNRQKRHDILIKAFSSFLKTNPEYILKIYGEGPDLKKDVLLCKKLGITKKVVFCGAQKNVHELIKNSACFVMTSDYEGMSNALIEAGLIGIPCVSSDWPGVEDIIQNDYNGLIYKRQNVKMLVNCLNIIVKNASYSNSLSSRFLELSNYYDEKTVLPLYAKVIEGDK